LDLNDEQAR